jgi:hypothetical protein
MISGGFIGLAILAGGAWFAFDLLTGGYFK